jgi:ligand-binding sensor domain-containing protein
VYPHPVSHILFFIFLWCAILVLQASGQYYSVYRYTSIEGLANTDVYRISQDKKGYMWFGTVDGLSRYDGSTFTNYGTDEGIYHSTILSMLDRNDSEKIISHYDGHIEVFANNRARDFNTNGQYKYGGIIQTLLDNNGLLMMDKAGRVYRLSEKKEAVLISTPDLKNGKALMRSMLKLADGRILLAAENGLYIYSNGHAVQPYMQKEINSRVYAIHGGQTGEVCVAIPGHILIIKMKTY